MSESKDTWDVIQDIKYLAIDIKDIGEAIQLPLSTHNNLAEFVSMQDMTAVLYFGGSYKVWSLTMTLHSIDNFDITIEYMDYSDDVQIDTRAQKIDILLIARKLHKFCDDLEKESYKISKQLKQKSIQHKKDTIKELQKQISIHEQELKLLNS